MIHLTELPLLRGTVEAWRRAGERIVLVPTMGALHRGHLALVDHARTLGDRVIVSIFVNPTQFGPNEDFSRYPRDEKTDLANLQSHDVDAVWIPSVETMYPHGFQTTIDVGDLAKHLCGPFRPGHFSGVATVVTKLVNQVSPDIAIFGEKDFQQLQIIRRVMEDLDIPVAIEGFPTVREHDGLALSSRNRYLSETERAIAPKLYETLQEIAAGARSGEPIDELILSAKDKIKKYGFTDIQYISINNEFNLDKTDKIESHERVFAAAVIGNTRLIDNLFI
ncbi:pantoate--beta-alanine ligase [Methylobacterium sp. sgz302541]|uniref:pantoate--beta-alanine ligase n=1 Tax=unclassified Methylobacterium TaxID=2615210 RepID=UPI003D352226